MEGETHSSKRRKMTVENTSEGGAQSKENQIDESSLPGCKITEVLVPVNCNGIKIEEDFFESEDTEIGAFCDQYQFEHVELKNEPFEIESMNEEPTLEGTQLDDPFPSGSEDEDLADDDSGDEYVQEDDLIMRRLGREIVEEEDEVVEEEEPNIQINSDRRSREWNWIREDLPASSCEPSKLTPKLGIPDEQLTPLSAFTLLFDDDIMNLFVVETNKYIHCNSLTNIKPITTDEMRSLLGILLLMSVVKMPQRHLYWAKYTRYPLVADVMNAKRFEAILNVLHVSDNSLEPTKNHVDYDPFFKIRPLINSINANIKKFAEDESHQCIDEQIVSFKGSHHQKVYIKSKQKKCGYKLWVRTGVSGYIYQFEMAGDLQRFVTHIETSPTLSASGKVVLRLVNNLPPGTEIYFDSYFTSPDLLNELSKRGLKGTGTLLSTRSGKCPLENEKTQRVRGSGSVDYRLERNCEILICKWFYNRSVLMASNCHSVEPMKRVKKYNKVTKQNVIVKCPAMIQNYSKCMRGVYKADMLLSLYKIFHKSKKWYKRLMFHFIDICINNAWMLYKEVKADTLTKSALSLVRFKTDVAHALIRTQTRSNISVPLSSAAVPMDTRYDGLHHLVEHIKNNRYGLRCRLEGCKQRCTYQCQKCKVSLCIKDNPNCFFKYHTR